MAKHEVRHEDRLAVPADFGFPAQRVLRDIRQAEGGRLTRTQLYRKTKHLTSKEREDIITSLLETGEIRPEKEETGGAPRVTYMAS